MENLISLRKHQWRIFLKNRSLVNCTVNPRNTIDKVKEDSNSLIKTKLLYYDLLLSKSTYLKLPPHIDYFLGLRLYLQYNCTLFDTKRKEFFGRTLLTTRENPLESVERGERIFFSTTNSERVLFHLYEIDVEDTILVIEAILSSNELTPKCFSVGFFMIDLLNINNKVEIVNESPRILLDKEGQFYLNKKIRGETELIYSIDTKQNMGLINNIVGPNTLY